MSKWVCKKLMPPTQNEKKKIKGLGNWGSWILRIHARDRRPEWAYTWGQLFSPSGLHADREVLIALSCQRFYRFCERERVHYISDGRAVWLVLPSCDMASWVDAWLFKAMLLAVPRGVRRESRQPAEVWREFDSLQITHISVGRCG